MSVYRGERTIDGIVVTCDGATLPDRVEHARYSDIGMDWGFAGPPARQLSFALLLDHLGDSAEARGLVDSFCDQVVRQLDNEWELSSDDMHSFTAALGAAR